MEPILVQPAPAPFEPVADARAVAMDVLRHRVLVPYQAHSEGMTSEDAVGTRIALVPLP